MVNVLRLLIHMSFWWSGYLFRKKWISIPAKKCNKKGGKSSMSCLKCEGKNQTRNARVGVKNQKSIEQYTPLFLYPVPWNMAGQSKICMNLWPNLRLSTNQSPTVHVWLKLYENMQKKCGEKNLKALFSQGPLFFMLS